MKNLLCTVWILAGFLIGGLPLWASEAQAPAERVPEKIELTLEEAVERVRKIHPDLRLQEFALSRAREEVRLATRAFLPDIDADYIASSAAGGWGLILTAARLLKPVFSLRSLILDREIQKIIQDREKVLLEVRTLEVTQEMKELYASLLVQTHLVKVLRENGARARKRLAFQGALYEVGRITRDEFLKVKADSKKALSESEKAKLYLAESESALRRLLGLGAGELSLEDPQGGESFSLTLPECFEAAFQRNPLLKALLLLEEASEKKRSKGKSKFVVDGLFLGLGDAGGGLFRERPRFGMTGNTSLYDWGKNRIQGRIRDLEHQMLLTENEKKLEGLKRSISENYMNLRALEGEKEASLARLDSARETLRKNRLLLKEGRVPEEEVLQAHSQSSLEELTLWQKGLEAWLFRERLLKDLGFSGMKEWKEAFRP